MKAKYQVISGDSHVNEPLEMFQERLPTEYRARAPHRVMIEGREEFVVEGTRPRRTPRGRIQLEGEFLERSQAGGYDPVLRLKDQERDGVFGEVIYAVVTQASFITPDPQFGMAMAQVYNDWTMEVLGSYSPRLAPAAVTPLQDVNAACTEMKRAVKMGFRAIFVPAQMLSRPYNSPEYNPLWATAQELGVPLCFHCGTGYEPRLERGDGGAVINYILGAQGDGPRVVTYMCASGVLERFPGLQFVGVETGSAWLAWILDSMDRITKQHHMSVFPKLKMEPSEYFKRQGHVTFQEDPIGVRNRDITGVEGLLFGNDYPHHEGTWPHTQQVIATMFKDVPEAETRKIVGGTAGKLFKFPSS